MDHNFREPLMRFFDPLELQTQFGGQLEKPYEPMRVYEH